MSTLTRHSTGSSTEKYRELLQKFEKLVLFPDNLFWSLNKTAHNIVNNLEERVRYAQLAEREKILVDALPYALIIYYEPIDLGPVLAYKLLQITPKMGHVWLIVPRRLRKREKIEKIMDTFINPHVLIKGERISIPMTRAVLFTSLLPEEDREKLRTLATELDKLTRTRGLQEKKRYETQYFLFWNDLDVLEKIVQLLEKYWLPVRNYLINAVPLLFL